MSFIVGIRLTFIKSMAAFIAVFLVSGIFVLSPPKALAKTANGTEVTVFIYHRFGETRYPTTNVDVDKFREQLAYLMANNYQVISLGKLIKSLADKTPLPEKSAVITIDDGYRSVYNKAWPVLKSFGFPFTVFLYVKATERGYNDFLTWDQIREMQKAGVDFQDHSYSHQRLANRPKGMAEDEYRAWISADLVKSNRLIMERLGVRPRYFAIPYGEYNHIVLEEAKSLGYEAILTQDPGSVGNGTDVFHIPREPILGDNWSTIKHFEMVLNRVEMPLSDIKPVQVPATKDTPAIFTAKVRYPKRYYPRSYELYVSELGWVKPNEKDGILRYESKKPLTRKMNRVIFKAQEKRKGRTAMHSYMLMN